MCLLSNDQLNTYTEINHAMFFILLKWLSPVLPVMCTAITARTQYLTEAQKLFMVPM